MSMDWRDESEQCQRVTSRPRTLLKFHGASAKVLECSMERKFHGSKSSLCGLLTPGNESAEERKV